MADITPGAENDVELGTYINGNNLNNNDNSINYVILLETGIPTVNGIESQGGPGGQLLWDPTLIQNGGVGIWGRGGDAGPTPGIATNQLTVPPGPGVRGEGGKPGLTDGANGVEGYGSGTHSGVAGWSDPNAGGAGVYGEGRGPNAVGVLGTGSGSPVIYPGHPVGVYGQGGPQNPGVIGQAGSAPADGVQGFGAGSFSGVAGFGDPASNGTGVYGEGRGLFAPGVRGIGSGSAATDPGGPVGVYGQGGPQNPGVVGKGGLAPADGVQGYGTGGFSGVAGFGDPAGNGTGVYGEGRGPGAQGVRGIGSGGANVLPSSPVDVYGQGGAGGAPGVWGAGGTGILAQGSNIGVQAEGGPWGINAIGATVGLRSQGHTGVVAVTDGKPGSTAVFASANGANETAGLFQGNVDILGDLLVTGLKAAVVTLADGTYRRLYCVESPDSWFEDIGSGKLVNGRATIGLDLDFAATVRTDDYHVFITEYDGNNALYVTARSATGFEVRAGAGPVGASFSYRVMAKRKDLQGARLQAMQLPSLPSSGQPPSVAPSPG
jgi:hypothetical protein